MTYHHRTKDDRKLIAEKCARILSMDPTVQMTGLAFRLGLKSNAALYRIRQEFGYPSLKKMKGRRP